MKKEVIVLLLLGILLISPLVLAQEQAQTYSGFNRFIDNVKLFFSSGDNKVQLALEIREKEVNSAINHIQNNNEDKAIKNLEKARKKLQVIQKKVSVEMAEEVQGNSEDILDKINENEGSLDELELYKLEEKKTQLTAELVIKVEGKEGQTLIREIVKDNESGNNKVEVVVGGDTNQTEVMEIEEKIVEIDIQIAEKIIAEKEMSVDYPSKIKENEDVTPAPNIVDDDIAPGPQGIVGNQGYGDDEGHYGEIPDEDGGASGEIDED